ncbi:MAG: biotin--[acetyl-CoA-carboxylase] ligase [Kiritimatiellae bacterium]|nr:biotin--[acetyl-CoA-carboxylase] ligase [Kiritimatiellia bacterium]
MNWRIFRKAQTVSTNIDARAGRPGDVFTALWQSAGRGRLDHKWLSAPGKNLMMSAVLDASGLPPEHAATLPLAVGLAVADAAGPSAMVKWPNDVLAGGLKLAGILCERHEDCVIAGIGVNVNETRFPPAIAARATSLALLYGREFSLDEVLYAVLDALAVRFVQWRKGGLAPLMDELSSRDFLKGRVISVVQTDDDGSPVSGRCSGIAPDGTLTVAGRSIWAGEAHVMDAGDAPGVF